MSKIKSKDLNYDRSLPPFLQRLHDQKAGHGDIDRHAQPIARAKRAKDPQESEGPTVVDESGETVSTEEYEKLKKAASESAHDTSSIKEANDSAGERRMSGTPLASATIRSDSKVTNGTAQKKRKAVKAIGGQDDAEDEHHAPSGKKVVKKAKKKAQPVKLAFDTEDD